jgi:branched-chain amino acid transport system substrate-binding protein
MNKKITLTITVLVLVLLVAGLVVLILDGNSVKNPSVTKIGISAPLTGFAAQYGERYMRGANMALEEVNANSKQKIELVVEDDQCAASGGTNVANKFFNIDKLHIQFVVCGASAPVFVPYVQNDDTLMLVNTVRTNTFEGKYPFLFNMLPSADAEMSKLADYIYNKEGIKEVALIYQTDFLGETYKDKFVKEFEQLGGTVKIIDGYDASAAKDYRATLNKVKDAHVTSVVNFISHPGNYDPLLRQAKELGLNLNFFSQYFAQNPLLLTTSGDLANGIVYTYSFKEPDTASYNTFKEKYKAKYGEDPETYAISAYESVMLVGQLNKDCKEDVKCMIAKLNSGKAYTGLIGDMKFKDNARDVPVYMKAVQNGQFVFL